MSTVSRAQRITQLMNSRRGKKGSITKRINQIDRIVSEGGSRSQVTYLIAALGSVQQALQAVCDELVNLDPDTDSEWLDTENLRIDTCISEAKAYLDRRRDDPPSAGSLTESWVKKHAAENDVNTVVTGASDDTHGVTNTFEGLMASQQHSTSNALESMLKSPDTKTTSHSPSEFLKPAHLSWTPNPNHSMFIPGEQRFVSFSEANLNNNNYDQTISNTTYQDHHMFPYSAGSFINNSTTVPATSFAGSAVNSGNRPTPSVGDGFARQHQYNSMNHPPPSVSKQSAPIGLHLDPHENHVDSWIDKLTEANVEVVPKNDKEFENDMAMGFFIQQSLPRMDVPVFDGSPFAWVEFITMFRDLIHNQPYLKILRKSTLLIQHLKGEPKKSVQGLPNNACGYVNSLKRLKFLFGQKGKIAQATILKITQGKEVPDHNVEALSDLYYSISDCLVTLTQLNYASDIHSSDTLRQVVLRLPRRLQSKWAELSLSIRTGGNEPSLVNLEKWLQRRVLVLRESYRPENLKRENASEKSLSMSSKTPKFAGKTEMKTVTCIICKGKHLYWKCDNYAKLSDIEKFNLAKKHRYCYNCLRDNHQTKECISKISCPKKDCKGRHHSTLHDFFSAVNKQNNDEKQDDADDEKIDEPLPAANGVLQNQISMVKLETEGNSKVIHSMLVDSEVKSIYLWVVPITIRSVEGVAYKTFGLLDNACQRSVLKDTVIEKLHTQVQSSTVAVGTVKDDPEVLDAHELTVYIESRDGKFKQKVDEIVAVPAERFKMPGQPAPPSLRDPDTFTHLDDIDICAVGPNQIEVLIGADLAEAFLVSEVRRGTKDQPLALNTAFGWTLFGATRGKIDTEITSICLSTTLKRTSSCVNKLWIDSGSSKDLSINTTYVHSPPKPDLEQLVENFWVQEHTGILPCREVAMSVEDTAAVKQLECGTRLTNGRYEVPMLWSNPNVQLPNNILLVKKRFSYLQKRLRNDPKLYQQYKETIEKYVSTGKARRMTDEEAAKTTNKTWYTPTHPVFHPGKPKPRVVNDAAAEYQGVSLNKSLVTGPDNLNSLAGVLLRFRVGRIVLKADIEAMFHQVRVTADDADALRFLWTDDIHSNDPPYPMQMLVHIFGAKDSLTCSIHALRQTAKDNTDRFCAATIETILKSFYVDDLLKSTHSEEDAILLAKELIEILKCGGFRLTKWVSNSATVLASIPESEIAKSMFIELDSDIMEKALGALWNVIDDTFTFCFNPRKFISSKRGVLKVTSSIFDPLGLLKPFVIFALILFQELWRQGIDWDDELTGDFLKLWEMWLRNAEKIQTVNVNRCYMQLVDPVSEIQLHMFCDASESAYGAVAYVRYSFKAGGHKCAFVMSKAKLAPIKTVTLPRLELCSAVVGARLSRMILHEIDMPIERTFFWADSTLALQYIHSTTNRYKVFVANRVTEIHEHSNKEQWGHVPGEENPADLLTRGVKDPSDLMTTNKFGTSWFGCTDFVKRDEDEWHSSIIEPLNAADVEIKRKAILVALGFMIMNKRYKIDLSRFSSWTKLKRVAAWFLKIIQIFRNKQFQQILSNWKKTSTPIDDLSCQEISSGEHFIIRDVQSVMFEREIRCLKNNKGLHARSQLTSLTPFLENNILRVGGRLRNASISYDAKHPIILPKNHPLTEMIIMDDHKSNGHVGRDHVLSNLQQRYWIIHSKSYIRAVIKKCFKCRVRKAKRMFPQMADLPSCRVAWKEPPYSNTGVDLFGPILIKQGRKRLKRWGVIFTCLTIRCVHLEVVESQDTDDFINSVRRFVNRRGSPTDVYSDCGTNFKGATAELSELVENLDRNKINTFATSHEISWHFNPPSAPHMGGAWERLIKSVKEIMHVMMQDRILTDSQFATLLTEVESILNNRPITHASTNIDDLEALTPNHILLGVHSKWDSMLDSNERDVISRRKWRQVQGAATEFWKRWRDEYLPTLMKRPCWRGTAPNYQLGELVVLKDDNPIKGKWELARVTKTLPGKDNVVRTVEVRTASGVYVRPVSKLAKLEDNE